MGSAQNSHSPKKDYIQKSNFAVWGIKKYKKNAVIHTATQNSKEHFYFIISHANELETISIERNHQFLIAKLEPGRRGTIVSVDISWKKEDREEKREEQTMKQQKRTIKDTHFLRSRKMVENCTSSNISKKIKIQSLKILIAAQNQGLQNESANKNCHQNLLQLRPEINCQN